MTHKQDYHKAYHAKWYAANKAARRKQIEARKRDVRKQWKVFKTTLICKRCGEDDSRCLEFHHRRKSRKEFTISTAVSKGTGWATLLVELAKCDVLCANCHRKIHVKKL